MTKNMKQNPKRNNWEEICSLAGLIVGFLSIYLDASQTKYWLNHKNELKNKLRKALIMDKREDVIRDFNKLHDEKPSFKQLCSLAGFIIEFLPTILTDSQIKDWLDSPFTILMHKLQKVFWVANKNSIKDFDKSKSNVFVFKKFKGFNTEFDHEQCCEEY